MRGRSNGRNFRRMMVSLLILLVSVSRVSAQANPALTSKQESPVTELKTNQPIERQINGAESHSYKIIAGAGQFIHAVIEQQGVDVVVTLLTTEGKKIFEVDSPNGSFGPESIMAITDTSGEYRIDIRPLNADAVSGSYVITLRELRAATEADMKRISTLAAAAEARAAATQLLSKTDDKSLKGAIEAYQKALVLFRESGDTYWEADSLNNIGNLYFQLEQMQQSLDFYNQALRLRKSVSSRSLESTILNNIGGVYIQLGEWQKALEFYQQALTLRIAVKDRAGAASSLNDIGETYYRLNQSQKALDSYNQALVLRRDLHDRKGEATVLNNIGLITSELGDKQKAIELYNEALQLQKAVGDQKGEATSLKNLADVYFILQQNQKALDLYLRSLTIRRTVGGGQIHILTSIGFIYNSRAFCCSPKPKYKRPRLL